MEAVFPAMDDGATVVTANKRLARNLMLAYSRRQRAAGHRAWPTPDILPWDAWIERFWPISLAAGGIAAERMLLGAQQESALWQRLVAESDARPFPGGEAGLARLARAAWRQSQDWRVGQAEIASTADSAATAAFAGWVARYLEQCAQLGAVDRGMLAALLAAEIQQGAIRTAGHAHLLGFDDWTPAQRHFLGVLGKAGWDLREQPAPQARGGTVVQIACQDPREEIDRAARWARRRLEVDPAALVAVVVPDLAERVAEVRRGFLEVFAPDWRLATGSQPVVNFSYGQPLASVGLVHAALLVLRTLSGRLDYRDAGQLLRTPYLPGGSNEAGARATLDLTVRELPGTRVAIHRLCEDAEPRAPVLAVRLRSLLEVTRAMPRRQSAAGWADTFVEALRAAGWPGDRGPDSDEHQALLAWQTELQALRSCDHVLPPLTYDEALGLLESLASDHVFQPAGPPYGVQVMGILEAIGQRFDSLWICGVTSEEWPPKARPSPMLSLDLQRRARMPGSSAPLVRERAERLLRWLENSAAEVVLSWPASRGDEPMASSPLTDHVAVRVAADLALWDKPGRHQSLLAARATELLEEDPVPPVDPALRLRGGAALLETQARCPARAFLEFRLGARELRQPVTGLDAGLRGSIAHAVLQEFYRRIADQRQLLLLSDAERSGLLTELIEAQLRRSVPLEELPLRAIAAEEQQRLHGLLTAFLASERERQSFSVLDTERVLSMPETPGPLQRLNLTLRADRIDTLADGSRLIVDYKTSFTPPALKDLWGERPGAAQLLLYAIAGGADAVAFVQLNAAGVRWIGVGEGNWGLAGLVPPARLTGGTHGDWPALLAAWRDALGRLAEEFLRGDFRVDLRHPEDAQGQWAMVTRVHELPESGLIAP
jgi:probable DNA repair protein